MNEEVLNIRVPKGYKDELARLAKEENPPLRSAAAKVRRDLNRANPTLRAIASRHPELTEGE